MLRVVPLGLVLGLRDEPAGGQVGDLQGLLVHFKMLVIGVGDRHLADRVREIAGQVGLGLQTVFQALARVDDPAVHGRLVASLRGFADHVLDDGRYVAADLRLVRGDGVRVDGLGALVRQRLAVRRGAERQFVARLLAEVVAHLARALAVGVGRLAGNEQRDLLRGLQSLQSLAIGPACGGGHRGAFHRDRPLVGDVPAVVGDVGDAGLAIGAGIGLVHLDLRLVVGVEQVVGGRPVVRERQGFRGLDEVLGDGAVDHRGDPVPVQKRHIVGAGPVGLLRVDDRLPLALRVQADPALVGIRPPRIELFLSGVGLGLVVPLAPRMVLDLLEVGGLRHGHVEAELVDMVHGHLALVRRTRGRCRT